MSGEIVALIIIACIFILALAFNKACDNISKKHKTTKKMTH